MATGIGEALRAARRQQGISLADAAASTRVRETYLAALEEEEFAALGGDVYVKGFLRSYARYLSLDPEPLLAAYKREHERPDELSPMSRRSPPIIGERERPPAAGLVIALAVLALLVFLAFRLFGGGGTDLDGIPAPATSQAAVLMASAEALP